MVWDDQTGTWTVSSSTYLINSTVLGGQLVTEVNNTGKKLQTYVIAAGAVIARQKVDTPDTSPMESVSWEHRDPGDTEVKYTNSSGGTSLDFVSDHYDTIGRMVGSPSFTSPTTPPHSIPSPFEEIPDELDPNKQCQVQVDGLLQKCDTVNSDNTVLSDSAHGNKVHPATTRLDDRLPGVLRVFVSGQLLNDIPDSIDANGDVHVNTHETPGHWETIGSVNYGLSGTFGGAGEKDTLGSCVVALLAGYFPDYLVDGRGVSIAHDARFIKGIPSAVQLVNPGSRAVTYGLYSIYYDSDQIDLNSPTWEALGVLAEELSHGEQFIQMWQAMPNVPYLVSNPKFPRAPITKTRRPNDSEALTQWELNYGSASASAVANGRDKYWDNQYEIDAQRNRDRIMVDLQKKYPGQYARGEKLCP